ncbi:MAG: winged helix-turn-helix transcriptional regulator [Actinomycetota bacterium]
MVRLLWLAPAREDPEESFPALLGIRPAPEPMAFSEASPESVSRRSPDVILTDGRSAPAEAAALVHKLRNDIEGAFLVVLTPVDLPGFDWTCGAADFVAGNCSPEEVRARIELVASPVEADTSDIIRRGPITIDRERFEVRVHNERLDLTFKEFELLAYLAARPRRVCTRSALLREVWGYDFFGGTRTVDVHIRRLRAKLGTEAHVIETVRNVGYRLSL